MLRACRGSCRVTPVNLLAGWRKIKLNQALVLLRLVLLVLVVYISCCLFFCVVTF